MSTRPWAGMTASKRARTCVLVGDVQKPWYVLVAGRTSRACRGRALAARQVGERERGALVRRGRPRAPRARRRRRRRRGRPCRQGRTGRSPSGRRSGRPPRSRRGGRRCRPCRWRCRSCSRRRGSRRSARPPRRGLPIGSPKTSSTPAGVTGEAAVGGQHDGGGGCAKNGGCRSGTPPTPPRGGPGRSRRARRGEARVVAPDGGLELRGRSPASARVRPACRPSRAGRAFPGREVVDRHLVVARAMMAASKTWQVNSPAWARLASPSTLYGRDSSTKRAPSAFTAMAPLYTARTPVPFSGVDRSGRCRRCP